MTVSCATEPAPGDAFTGAVDTSAPRSTTTEVATSEPTAVATETTNDSATTTISRLPIPRPGVQQYQPEVIKVSSRYNEDSDDDFSFMVSETGEVLWIASRNIYAGSTAYRTWDIGPSGFQQLRAKIEDLALLKSKVPNIAGSTGPVVSLSVGERFDLEASGLNNPESELTAEQAELRSNLSELLELVKDMSWMEDVTPTPPELWIPNRLTLSVRTDEYDSRYYTTPTIPWPLETPVLDLVRPGDNGKIYICLADEQAAAAWEALMIDEVNHARLPVADDGFHEMGIHVSDPGSQLHSVPCPPATNFSNKPGTPYDQPNETFDPDSTPPSSARDYPATDEESPYDSLLAPLLFSIEDVPAEWDVRNTPVIQTNLEVCPGEDIPGEQIVDEYDRWLYETVYTHNDNGSSLNQSVGWAPADSDPASMIAELAQFKGCSNPLGKFYETGAIGDLPEAVLAGSYWMKGNTSITAFFALHNGIVMAVSIRNSQDPPSLDSYTALLETLVAKIGPFEDHLRACAAAAEAYSGSLDIGYLEGCERIAEYLAIERTW